MSPTLPLAAVLLLVGACGGAGTGPDAGPASGPDVAGEAGPGVPVPAASPADRPASVPVPAGATTLQRVAAQLEADVVGTARVPGPASTACDAPLDRDGEVRCTVTYAGLRVPYTVTVTDGGTPAAGFALSTTQGVLVREALWTSVGSSPAYDTWLDPRCQQVPAVQLVPLGEPSGVTCSYRRRGAPEVRVTADVVLERYDVTLRPR